MCIHQTHDNSPNHKRMRKSHTETALFCPRPLFECTSDELVQPWMGTCLHRRYLFGCALKWRMWECEIQYSAALSNNVVPWNDSIYRSVMNTVCSTKYFLWKYNPKLQWIDVHKKLQALFPCVFLVSYLPFFSLSQGGCVRQAHRHTEKGIFSFTSFPSHCLDTAAIISVGTCSIWIGFIFTNKMKSSLLSSLWCAEGSYLCPTASLMIPHISIPGPSPCPMCKLGSWQLQLHHTPTQSLAF